ncbi:MAG: AAA family ATPase [Candidatus Aenigmarchaeota archaeon]|nr:AAA family ATPase [Candidatus Aenigmarchaeota archaeon]
MAIVVGIMGLIGSGKDEAADYMVKKYGFHKIALGDVVREYTKKDGLELNRINLQKTQKKYRDRYGKLFFSDKVIEKVKEEGWEKSIIAAIRVSQETKSIKKAFGKDIKIIIVEASPKIRFERLKKRKSDRDPKTFEEFQVQERNESKYFDYENTFKLADIKITNNGTRREFYKKIDDLMKNIRFV